MKRMMVCLIALFLMVPLCALPLRVSGDYSGNITINSDGSVSPSDAPILTVDNITYTFTDNITGSLAVHRNNTIIDGNGFILDGKRAWQGLSLLNLTNVQVKNTVVTNFTGFGIELDFSSNCTLSDNNVTNSWTGIHIYRSFGNIVSENNVRWGSNTGIGVGSDSSHNVVSRNNISGYYRGIGIGLTSDNIISGNNASNNQDGIEISYSSGNTLSGNYVANNHLGIQLFYSWNNILSGNVMQNNGYNFGVFGAALSHFMNSVDTSNLVNGKPVYYLVNQSNTVISPEFCPDAGYLGLANCVNMTVQGFTFTHVMHGILFGYVNESRVIGNNLVDNLYGIELVYSFNNTLCDNNVTDSYVYGMYIEYSFSNRIFHNNFVKNSTQTSDYLQTCSIMNSVNTWDDDYQSGGNYWSCYTGKDNNQDGIGDTPYIVEADNTDHYPLMGTYSSFKVWVPPYPTGGFENVNVICNFTISDLNLYAWLTTPNQYLQAGQLFLRLSPVLGKYNTVGFCRLTVPNSILNTSDYIVLAGMNSVNVRKLLGSNSTHTILYFTFNTSTNDEVIIVPEFPSFLILPLLFMAILLTVTFCRKKLTRTA